MAVTALTGRAGPDLIVNECRIEEKAKQGGLLLAILTSRQYALSSPSHIVASDLAHG